MLDAFFYGRALAEVLNERLGAVADDFLVEFNKRDAERRQAFRYATLSSAVLLVPTCIHSARYVAWLVEQLSQLC